ncbi:MAG TPA: serine/threonine-protein kinase [Planctomycetota bacterium]|nr:serine/threonine-protein kinase [Planctomycetota bacterium]
MSDSLDGTETESVEDQQTNSQETQQTNSQETQQINSQETQQINSQETQQINSQEIQQIDSQETQCPNKPLLFGGYQVKAVLGEGGLGVVYLAKQLSMKRNVALKVLYSQWMRDTEFRKRFLLEARIAGKLSHPNLIQVFDVGYDNERYYFSMEYVKGLTIEDMIMQEEKLSVPRALDYCLQVLEALQYIWERNLIHRDIKPNNIMVNSRNVAKLGDFGFVKSPGDEALTASDFVLGTPDYMSPEQAMGKEKLDYRCDIYALGASLYHMVTGQAPYSGSASMVIKKHIKENIPSPLEIDPTLPESVCFVIEKMMAKSPDDRYQTYEELKEDLLAIKEGRKHNVQRLDAGKTTIARVDKSYFEIIKLKKQIAVMQRREYFYWVVILFLVLFLLFISVSLLWDIV